MWVTTIVWLSWLVVETARPFLSSATSTPSAFKVPFMASLSFVVVISAKRASVTGRKELDGAKVRFHGIHPTLVAMLPPL
jgi:hypothetical protein